MHFEIQTPQPYAARLCRRKPVTDACETNLRRCLSTLDITLLGIGYMVGSGIYVFSSTVAKNIAGPSIVVSFAVSGFAACLSALCYAELGVRYPKSGSAYSYTYITLGEVWAFIVGWSMALEGAIGIASVARTCSSYIDSLAGGVIRNGTDNFIGPVHITFASDHLDFLAPAIVFIFVAVLSFGLKITSYVNNVVTVANIVILVGIVFVGAYFSDTINWTNSTTGGFMPQGFSGIISASACLFYAYLGFDSIASAGEEAEDPQTSIPIATFLSMGITTACYIGVATVLTLMVNYTTLADESGLPEAFATHGATWAKIIIIIGAISSMCTTIIAGIFTLTRVVYAMASDGLLFNFCSKVYSKWKVPFSAMYIFSFLSALLSMFLDVDSLIQLLSIGTLLSYIMVSASVIILRYRPVESPTKPNMYELNTIVENRVVKTFAEDTTGQLQSRYEKLGQYVKLPPPGRMVTMCVVFFTVSSFTMCCFLKFTLNFIYEQSWWAISILVFLVLCLVGSLVIILLHKQSQPLLRYTVPLSPFLPALSIVINCLLITNLHALAWLRLLFWLGVGLSIYMAYGIDRSKLETMNKMVNPYLTRATFEARNVVPKRNRPKVVASSLSREQLFANVDAQLSH